VFCPISHAHSHYTQHNNSAYTANVSYTFNTFMSARCRCYTDTATREPHAPFWPVCKQSTPSREFFSAICRVRNAASVSVSRVSVFVTHNVTPQYRWERDHCSQPVRPYRTNTPSHTHTDSMCGVQEWLRARRQTRDTRTDRWL
jgi:hypothetical protein